MQALRPVAAQFLTWQKEQTSKTSLVVDASICWSSHSRSKGMLATSHKLELRPPDVGNTWSHLISGGSCKSQCTGTASCCAHSVWAETVDGYLATLELRRKVSLPNVVYERDHRERHLHPILQLSTSTATTPFTE